MRYEILFIQKPFGQPWEEAIKANEARSLAAKSSDMSDSQSIGDHLDQVARLLQEVNPKLSRNEDLGSVTLSDDASGLHIVLKEGEKGISIPYHHTGRSTWKQMTYAYKYAKIIERETGLIGYDRQRSEAFLHSEEPVRDSAELLSSMSKGVNQDGVLPEDNPQKALVDVLGLKHFPKGNMILLTKTCSHLYHSTAS